MKLTIKFLDKKNISYIVSAAGFFTIHGDLDLRETDIDNLDKLEEVSGNIYLSQNAKLDAPNLTDSGEIIFNGTMYGQNFRNFDGIGAIVLSENTKDGITITFCKKSNMIKGKFLGEKFYVATKGKKHAHGTTIRQAIEELLFKTGERDVSQFKNMPLKTVKTPDEWAFVYRIVTGACQYGVKQFMERQKLKEKYTLTEIIKLTTGAYGGEKFATFMKESK